MKSLKSFAGQSVVVDTLNLCLKKPKKVKRLGQVLIGLEKVTKGVWQNCKSMSFNNRMIVEFVFIH